MTAAGDGNGIGDAGVSYRLDSQDSLWVTRIGLNYRFGDVAARARSWRNTELEALR